MLIKFKKIKHLEIIYKNGYSRNIEIDFNKDLIEIMKENYLYNNNSVRFVQTYTTLTGRTKFDGHALLLNSSDFNRSNSFNCEGKPVSSFTRAAKNYEENLNCEIDVDLQKKRHLFYSYFCSYNKPEEQVEIDENLDILKDFNFPKGVKMFRAAKQATGEVEVDGQKVKLTSSYFDLEDAYDCNKIKISPTHPPQQYDPELLN